MQKYYAYIARCNDGTLYCGYTNNIEDREEAHNNGLGAKYTRGRGPVKIVYFEEFQNRDEAMRREASLKKLTRVSKENLINTDYSSSSG